MCSCPPVFFLPGTCEEKQRSRRFEQPVTSELASAQCPRASLSQREHSPVLFTQLDQRPSTAASDVISFGASDNEMDNSLSLAASDAEELSNSMADPMVFTGTPSGSPPMLVPLLPRSALRAHEILACALFISHPPLFFSRSHFL